MNHYVASVLIGAPIERVFDFHTDPNNLLKIMPGEIEIVSLKKTGEGQGMIIELAMRWRKLLTLNWKIELEMFDRPNHLVDLQLKGPFKFFRHSRTFAAVANGTEMTDDLNYVLPLGPMGRLVDTLVIRRIVASQFAMRHRLTKQLLEAT